MTNKDNIWPLLSRYFDNSMREGDSEELERWLDQSNENRRILHAIDRIWKASEERPQDTLISELNLEKDWHRVASRLSPESPEIKRAKILHFRKLRKKQQAFSRLLKIAALFLVAFISAVITYQVAPQTVQGPEVVEPIFNEIATNAAERANIELGDGSRVMLNAASRLTIPERFSQHKREVQLQGQAFFDIRSDRNRPFYIRTGKAVVEVVGTSFDIRSYPDEEDMIVAVREGTVELKRLDDPDNRLIVNEGYFGQVSKTNGKLALAMFDDPLHYFGWMEGRLIFNETPMTDVFRQIERWYDVQVKTELSEQVLRDMKFSADLKTRSVQEVVDVIQMSMDVEVKVRNSKILVNNLQ